MWLTTAFLVARGSIQKISSNQKFVEKPVTLHLSDCIACIGQSARTMNNNRTK